MPKRLPNSQLCGMKVSELKRLASSNDIPIKNPDGKMKLKCDLIVDLVKAGIPTTSPEYDWLEEAPKSKPKRKVRIDEDEGFVDISDQRYARRIQDEAGVSFAENPSIMEFIPDEKLKKKRKYPKSMTTKIDGQPVLIGEQGLLEFIPRKVRNQKKREEERNLMGGEDFDAPTKKVVVKKGKMKLDEEEPSFEFIKLTEALPPEPTPKNIKIGRRKIEKIEPLKLKKKFVNSYPEYKTVKLGGDRVAIKSDADINKPFLIYEINTFKKQKEFMIESSEPFAIFNPIEFEVHMITNRDAYKRVFGDT